MGRWKGVDEPVPNDALITGETEEEREARVEALRQAYAAGTLDLTVRPDHEGVDRLLQDLFAERRPRRTRR